MLRNVGRRVERVKEDVNGRCFNGDLGDCACLREDAAADRNQRLKL